MGSGQKNSDHDTDPVFGYDPDPHYLPRWVKVFAVIGLIILAGIVVMFLSGHHGPSRHL